MRITGGQARGIPLSVLRGDAVRPATDALRQALFSSIGARVEGARFLDLFAGSGAYGLEALSRGAAGGLFVERDRRTVAFLEKNFAAVTKSLSQRAAAQSEKTTTAKILTADVSSPSWEMAATALAPDLVFIDPPYEIIETIADPLFARLRTLLASQVKPTFLQAKQTGSEFPLSPPESLQTQPEPVLSHGDPVPVPLVIFELPGGLELAPEGWLLLKRLGGKNRRQPSLMLFEPTV